MPVDIVITYIDSSTMTMHVEAMKPAFGTYVPTIVTSSGIDSHSFNNVDKWKLLSFNASQPINLLLPIGLKVADTRLFNKASEEAGDPSQNQRLATYAWRGNLPTRAQLWRICLINRIGDMYTESPNGFITAIVVAILIIGCVVFAVRRAKTKKSRLLT
jgi:hypothetical protein